MGKDVRRREEGKGWVKWRVGEMGPRALTPGGNKGGKGVPSSPEGVTGRPGCRCCSSHTRSGSPQ